MSNLKAIAKSIKLASKKGELYLHNRMFVIDSKPTTHSAEPRFQLQINTQLEPHEPRMLDVSSFNAAMTKLDKYSGFAFNDAQLVLQNDFNSINIDALDHNASTHVQVQNYVCDLDVTYDAKEFLAAYKQVKHAINKVTQDVYNRENMAVVHLHKNKMIATNGNTLAQAELSPSHFYKGSSERGVSIAHPMLKAIEPLIKESKEIRIAVSVYDRVSIYGQDWQAHSLSDPGVFPSYERVLPDTYNWNTAKLDEKALLFSKIYKKEETIVFAVKDDSQARLEKRMLSIADIDVRGNDTTATDLGYVANMYGATMRIGINPVYLYQLLNIHKKLTMRFTSLLQPLVFEKGSEVVGLIMPMHLKE